MEETTVPAGNGVREDSMAGTTMSAGSSVMGDRMGGGLPGNSMAVRPVAVHTHRGYPVTGGVTDGSLDAPLPGMGEGDGFPDIENDLPNDVIEAPTTMEEVYRGSMKALLLRNIGNYVVATFLIGTQTTVSWEGILYDVGNDYLAIYQSGRDQYIVSDLYSLKYVEFYDTRSRELCDAMLGGEAQENR